MARAELAAHRRQEASQMTSKLMSRVAYLFRHDEINIYNEGDKSFNFTYNQHVGELTLLDFGIPIPLRTHGSSRHAEPPSVRSMPTIPTTSPT